MRSQKEVDELLSHRSCGILLHISSLPSPYHCGDLGKYAYKFCDFLSQASQKFWQMLPINPIGEGNCPYVSISAFAGEPLFIDIEDLYKEGLVTRKDIMEIRDSNYIHRTKVKYQSAFKNKYRVFKKAFVKFFNSKKYFLSDDYDKFQKQNKYWLDDFSLFCVLAEKFQTCDWSRWPKEFRKRDTLALKAVRKEFYQRIHFYIFLQYKFFIHWARLQRYCHLKGIRLIGDLPIFIAYQSADVWANQKIFKLNVNTSRPLYVSGVPPDYFCPDGQLWGTPVYDWKYIYKDGFSWWISRLKKVTELFDLVRIDHFIGFSHYWEIPYRAKTAKYGKWRLAYGEKLFEIFKQKFKVLPFIVEDLGLVTQKVIKLRDKFNFLGMRVLQFAFNKGEGSKYHMPYNYPKNSIVYIGTHDNNTAKGWYKDIMAQKDLPTSPYDYKLFKKYFYFSAHDTVHWDLIQELYKSPANICILQMQDILGLSSDARMNVPGIAKGNWVWACKPHEINNKLAFKLADLVSIYNRLNNNY